MKKVLCLILTLAIVFACVSMVTFGSVITANADGDVYGILLTRTTASNERYYYSVGVSSPATDSDAIQLSDLNTLKQLNRTFYVQNRGNETIRFEMQVQEYWGNPANGQSFVTRSANGDPNSGRSNTISIPAGETKTLFISYEFGAYLDNGGNLGKLRLRLHVYGASQTAVSSNLDVAVYSTLPNDAILTRFDTSDKSDCKSRVSQITTPMEAQTFDGSAETAESMSAWSTMAGHGGIVTRTEGGAYDSNYHVHFQPAYNGSAATEYSSPLINLSAALLNYPAAGFQGGGEGKMYRLSFWARSTDDHTTPDNANRVDVLLATKVFAQGGTNVSGYVTERPLYYTLGSVYLTTEWQKVTFTINTTDAGTSFQNLWSEAFECFKASGNPNYLNLSIRMDASGGGRAYGIAGLYEYDMDEITLGERDAVSYGSISATNVYNHSSAAARGLLSTGTIENGVLTKNVYMYNGSANDVAVRISCQTTVYYHVPDDESKTIGKWEGPSSDNVIIRAGTTGRITFSLPVNEENKIIWPGGNTYSDQVINTVTYPTVVSDDEYLSPGSLWLRIFFQSLANAGAPGTGPFVFYTDNPSDWSIFNAIETNVSGKEIMSSKSFHPLTDACEDGKYEQFVLKTSGSGYAVARRIPFTQSEINDLIAAGKIHKEFTVYNADTSSVNFSFALQAEINSSWVFLRNARTTIFTIPAGESVTMRYELPIDESGNIVTSTPVKNGDDLTFDGNGNVIYETVPLNQLVYRFNFGSASKLYIHSDEPGETRRIYTQLTSGDPLDRGLSKASIWLYAHDDNGGVPTPVSETVFEMKNVNSLDSYGNWSSTGTKTEATGFDGGFAVRYVPADQFGTITYDLSPAILPPDFNRGNDYEYYNGAGAGRYEVGFWARLDDPSVDSAQATLQLQALTNADRNTLQNSVWGPSKSRNCNLLFDNYTILLTNSWKYYTRTIDVTQSYIDAIAAADNYKEGNWDGRVKVALRIDGSSATNNSLYYDLSAGAPRASMLPYIIDDITIRKADQAESNSLTLDLTNSGLDDVIVTANGTPVSPVNGKYAIGAASLVNVSIGEAEIRLAGVRRSSEMVNSTDGVSVSFPMPAYSVTYEVLTTSADSYLVPFVNYSKVYALLTVDEIAQGLPTLPTRPGCTTTPWHMYGYNYANTAEGAAKAAAAAQSALDKGWSPAFYVTYTPNNDKLTLTTDSNAYIVIQGGNMGESVEVDPMTVVKLHVKNDVDGSGNAFVGWRRSGESGYVSYDKDYAFYMTDRNLNIVPVFLPAATAAAVRVKPELRLHMTWTSETNKISVVSERDIPSGLTLTAFGILMYQTETPEDNYDSTLTLENGMYHIKAPATKLFARGTYYITKANVSSGNSWVARCYATYTDSAGTSHTVYSEVSAITASGSSSESWIPNPFPAAEGIELSGDLL